MKFLVLTSAALDRRQVLDCRAELAAPGADSSEIRRVASLNEIPPGSSLVFQYPGELDNCVLVRLSERDLVAYGQKSAPVVRGHSRA